jgi:hypothetical protein
MKQDTAKSLRVFAAELARSRPVCSAPGKSFALLRRRFKTAKEKHRDPSRS